MMDAIGLDVYNQYLTGDVSMTLTAIRSDPHHVPCVVLPCWWDGGQTSSTIHGSLCGGGGVQYMPDKQNFGCVIVDADDSDT